MFAILLAGSQGLESPVCLYSPEDIGVLISDLEYLVPALFIA